MVLILWNVIADKKKQQIGGAIVRCHWVNHCFLKVSSLKIPIFCLLSPKGREARFSISFCVLDMEQRISLYVKSMSGTNYHTHMT